MIIKPVDKNLPNLIYIWSLAWKMNEQNLVFQKSLNQEAAKY